MSEVIPKPPRFSPGDKVRLTCEGKHECGSTGVVVRSQPYQGPRIYADWECKLRDVRWASGDPAPNWTVPETWLELIEGT